MGCVTAVLPAVYLTILLSSVRLFVSMWHCYVTSAPSSLRFVMRTYPLYPRVDSASYKTTRSSTVTFRAGLFYHRSVSTSPPVFSSQKQLKYHTQHHSIAYTNVCLPLDSDSIHWGSGFAGCACGNQPWTHSSQGSMGRAHVRRELLTVLLQNYFD